MRHRQLPGVTSRPLPLQFPSFDFLAKLDSPGPTALREQSESGKDTHRVIALLGLATEHKHCTSESALLIKLACL